MVTLNIFRDEWVAPYLAAAFATTRGYAAIWAPEKIELLRQVIALCDAAVNIEPSYALPVAGAPLRAAIAQAVDRMRAEFYLGDQQGSAEETVHCPNVWNTLFRHATKRLAALETAHAV